ncbi:hypothetical protein AB3X91_16265 [Paraburkholderia sp. BR14263]|uniref:hypothetical protein n=1 Tax=unclassified Paraburkholderia TaxID=2615204 RepID=UPI0034CD78F9
MAQVPNYQVPSHPSGLEMRTQLNAIILAIIGDNAGPTEPAQTFPGMMWGDTTAMRLRRRTNANDGWIDIGPLDDFMQTARDAAQNAINVANTKVARAGDSMTGRLTMYGEGVARGEIAMHSPGTSMCYFRAGDPGTGGVDIVNNAYSAVLWRMADDGRMFIHGRIATETEIWDGDYNGYSTRIGNGYMKLAQWGHGAYIDLMRARDQDFRWRIHYSWGNDWLAFESRQWNINFTPDSNIHCDGRGWVWENINHAINVANDANNTAANRAPWGWNCQHNSGHNDFGDISNNTMYPNPWVAAGFTGNGNATANAIRTYGMVLRNA